MEDWCELRILHWGFWIWGVNPLDGSVVAEHEYRDGRGHQTDIEGALREHVRRTAGSVES